MKAEELSRHAHISLIYQEQELVVPLVYSAETKTFEIILPGSQMFAGLEEMRMKVTPGILQQIVLLPNGVAQLRV